MIENSHLDHCQKFINSSKLHPNPSIFSFILVTNLTCCINLMHKQTSSLTSLSFFSVIFQIFQANPYRHCLRCVISCLVAVSSLQTLLLDGNFLSTLPPGLGSLERLTYLGLSFNCFSCVPPVLEKLRGMERLCLAGNKLSVLDVAGLQWLPAHYIDLR